MLERFDRFFKTDEEKIKEADNIIALLKDSPDLAERRRQHDEQRVNRIREFLALKEQTGGGGSTRRVAPIIFP